MTAPSAAAVAAAAWWARAVGAPSYDNGEPMHGVLATMAFAGSAASPSASASFADLLADRIQADLDRQAEWRDGSCAYVTLGVDYGPDRALAEPAAQAGISMQAFPWKTSMWIYADYVTVSAGYRAESRLVWASDEWLAARPVCGSQQYDDGKYAKVPGYHGEPWKCSLPMYHDGGHQYDVPLPLCAKCGAPEEYWHDESRTHDPKRHPFVAAAETGASREAGAAGAALLVGVAVSAGLGWLASVYLSLAAVVGFFAACGVSFVLGALTVATWQADGRLYGWGEEPVPYRLVDEVAARRDAHARRPA